jgi:DNA-binding NtrC family response regulator
MRLFGSEKGMTVLVVDDDVIVRMVISDYLRHCGYRVIEAANGDEAVALLANARIPIHVVLSDVKMPGELDGFGLSQWIRSNRPGVHVILAGTVGRAVDAATDLCENGPRPQPYEPEAVANQIKRLSARRQKKKKGSQPRSRRQLA